MFQVRPQRNILYLYTRHKYKMNVSLNPCLHVHDILNFMINVNNVTENNIGSIPVQKLKNTK